MHGADVNIVKYGSSQTKENLKNKDDCHFHEHMHCRLVLSLPWKVKGSVKKEGKESRGGSWNDAHAGMHFEDAHNEAGRDSIKKNTLENVQ